MPTTQKQPRARLRFASMALVGAFMFTGCALDPGLIANIDAQMSRGSGTSAGGSCGVGSGSGTGLTATGTVDSLNEEQNEVARLLLGVAKEREGIADEDRPKLARILLITGFQESSLKNINYGDDIYGITNPDGSLTSSLGVFQQQKWWGTVEERTDVKKAANLFINALVKFDWVSMEEGAAAQKVQASAHPTLYSKHINFANQIIEAMGDDYKDLGGDGGSSGSGCKGGKGTGSGGAGDDYPLAATPAAIASGFDPALDPWGLYVGQCVSYVAWRINVQMGWKEGEEYPFTMSKMQMAGQGNGYEWSAQLAEMGYVTDQNPKKGAIAWWDSNANEYVGKNGHVAIVESYDLEAGTVTVSQYNMQPKPLQYSEYTFPIEKISGFIHVADLE